MNKSYRSIWNAAKQVYVAAAETVSARGKPCSGTKIAARIAVLTGGLLALTANAQTAPPPNALPTGGQVSAGQATISQNGANMVVTQGSDRAAIDWQSFNVGQNAHVQFQQPGASSVALNRVVGPDPSQIFGRITANGQVILTNPAGVYFGPSARVDVGGLIATTHSISNDDFMAGKYTFERNGSEGKVINEGELKAAIEGYVALLAPEVRNQGAIIAQMGTVALAAGEAFDLHFDSNNRLTSIRVEPSQIETLVENRYAVKAPGGLVILSAQSMDRLIGGVVKNSGTIEANGLKEQGGRIILAASNTVENTGIVRADAADGLTLADSGPAGSIDIAAPKVVNSGTISANGSKTATAPANRKGGKVKITATEAVVNSGKIEATSAAPVAAVQDAGRIQVQAPRIEQTASGRMDVSGDQQGGTLALQASGAVTLAGSLDASAKLDTDTQGGLIDVTTPGPITLLDAQLDTSGGQGGQIQLKAFATETVIEPAQPATPLPLPEDTNPGHLAILGNSSINSRGRSRNGGRVALLGDHIALNDNTRIDVTGATGGGEVLVGGDWQGGANTERRVFDDPSALYQATSVSMAKGVFIDASATDHGNGGTIVLWSDINKADSVTTAGGTLLAKGGVNGGKGGQVETSGAILDFDGVRVNTSATDGTAGDWLLDPWNFYFNASQLSALASNLTGSNITVSTAGSSASGGPTTVMGSGHIVFQDNFTYGGANARTLTLSSQADIWINGNITSSGAALGLSFNAPGSKRVLIDGDILTNGGSVSFNNNAAVHFQKASGTQTVNTANGSLNFGNSNVNLLRHEGEVVFTTGTGALSLGNATVSQTNTRYIVDGDWLMGWGGRHSSASNNQIKVYSDKTITSGREYTVRLVYWGSWNGALGSFFIQTASGNVDYFRANKNSANQIYNVANLNGTVSSVGYANNDAFVDFTFIATHSGKPGSYTSSAEIEVQHIFETDFPTQAFQTGSRSLTLKTTSGQLNVGETRFSDLKNLTLDSNSNYDQVGGVISGETNVIKSGSGRASLAGLNTYSGTTTVNAGTLGVYRNTAIGSGNLIMADNTTLLLGRAVTSLSNNIDLLGAATVDLDTEIEYLVVGGGGGGGNAYDGAGGGGGGAGGMLAGVISAAGGTVGVAVGTGGAGGAANSTAGVSGTNGGNSVLGSLVANGGGGGGGSRSNGSSGGSGGGGGSRWTDIRPGGFGISPQGNAGGTNSGGQHASGGGGAGSVGGSYGNNAGGAGLASSISGVPVLYARGGVGGLYSGDRGTSSGPAAQGYGGGGGAATANYGQTAAGAAGNSGIVIARYKGPVAGTGGSVTPGAGDATGYTLHTFTNTGTYSLTLNALAPTLSGIISGAGNLKVNATDGSVTLSGANTYSGGTTLTGGVLKTITSAYALGSGAVSLDNIAGARLDVAGDLAIGSLSGGGTIGGHVTVGSGYTLTTGTLNTTTTYAGVISGAGGGLAKTGSGTFTLTGNSTYSGATTINDGTLVLQNNAPASSSSGFSGPGALRIESGLTSFNGAFNSSDWTFDTTLGGLTIGKEGNTQAIMINKAISVSGPVSIYGGPLALDKALSSGDTVTLKSSGDITQSTLQEDAVSARHLQLLGGNVSLNNMYNNVETLAASGVSGLTYTDVDALTLGSVGSSDGISASGLVNIATMVGDLTVSKNVSTTNASANALVLNAGKAALAGNVLGGNIQVTGGSTAGVGGGGTARLYSGGVLGSSGLADMTGLESGSGRFRYGGDENTSAYTKALTSGLNVIYRERPVAQVTVADKSITYGDTLNFSGVVNSTLKSADGASDLAFLGATILGDTTVYEIENRADSSSGNVIAGIYTLTETGLAALGYNVTVTKGDLAVAQKEVALTGLLANDKTYDGTTTATVHDFGTLSGKVTGDTLTLNSDNATASFDTDKHVGANKAVTVSNLSLAGDDAGNYNIIDQKTTAAITQAALILKAVTETKVYDATTTSGVAVEVTGLKSDDTITGQTQSFESQNVQGVNGSVLQVDSGYTISDGNDGKNYAVVTQTATGTITPKALTVSGLGSADKVYDGTTYAVVNGTATLANAVNVGEGNSSDGARYGGDDVSVSGAAIGTFNSKDVIDATTVVFSGLMLSGSQAGNYSLTPHADTHASITPKALTIKANNDAKFVTEGDIENFSGVTYSGFVNGETAEVLDGALAITRNNAEVQTAGTYASVLEAGGLASSNYSLNYVKGDYTIVAANQLLVRVDNKSTTYGVPTGYTISSAKYLGADNQIVDLTNDITVDAGKFVVHDGADGSASFALKALEAQFSTAGKLKVGSYQLGLDGLVTENSNNFSDTITVIGAHQVNAQGLTAAATAGVSKTYDGNTAMTGITLDLDGQVTNDLVDVTGIGAFDSKNAGSNLGYTIANLKLDGNDAANYYLSGGNQFTGTNGEIDKRTINVAYTGVDKVYDGDNTATVTTTDNRITGDNLTINHTATFAASEYDVSGKNVALDADGNVIAKNIDIKNASLAGTDAGNYALASPSGSATAKITPASLIISGITGVDKVYDKKTDATLDLAALKKTGLVNGDTVNVNTSASFSDANAANGKAVTINSTFDGVDAGNYSITPQAGTSASITRRAVAVSAAGGVSKVYDGTTDMNGVTIGLGQVDEDINSGLIDGDNLTVSGTGSFSTANAGTGKDYTLSGLQLGGTDVANYTIAGGVTSVSGNDGVITPKTITATGISAVNKVYDGSVKADLTGGSLIGVVGSDEVTLSGQTGVFSDKNVGTDKEVNITNIGLAGAAKGNYVLADASKTATSSANIARLGSVTWIGGNSGNWFDPTKWAVTGNLSATGVVPDLANVSNVVLQDGGTVTFADTDSGRSGLAQTGTVQIDGLTGASANLVMSDGAIQIGTGGATLAGLAQTGGDISSTGDVTVNGSFSQSGGTLTTTGTDADISITQTSGDLSWKSMTSGGNLTLSSPGKTVFGHTTVGGNLVSITQGAEAAGGVSQAADTSLNVSGTSTFTADTGVNQIASLNAAANNFTGAVSFGGANSGRWKDLTLVDGSGGLKLGNITADGTLNLKSTDGAIDQEEDTAVNITGTTTLEASNGATPATTYDINLGKANDFQGDVTVVNGNNVTLNDTNGLGFGNVTTTGGFNATAVTGDVILKADVNAGSVSLDATAGNINQPSGKLVVDGQTNLSAGDNITLAQAYNDFKGLVNVLAADAVKLFDANNLELGGISTTGKLDATAGNDLAINGQISAASADLEATTGDIAQGADGKLTVTAGPTDLKAGDDITLDKSNDFNGAVNVLGGNDVVLNDTTGLELGNVTTTGNLQAKAAEDLTLNGAIKAASADLEATTGNISQGTNGTLTVTTGPTDLKAGTDITLDKANDFNGAVNIESAQNVVLNDGNSLELGNVTTTGKLDATAGSDLALNGTISAKSTDLEAVNGNISQGTNGTLTVTTGPTDLKAGNDITLDKANDFNGAVNIDSAKNVVLNDSNALELDNVTTTGKLDATAGSDLSLNGSINAKSADLEATSGDITQGTNGKLIVSDGPTDLKAGNDITLDKSNDFNGAVNVLGGNDVVLNDTTGLELGNVTTTGNLQAKAAEDLTLSGTTTVGGKLDATAGTNLALNGAINAASAGLEAASGGISQGANSTVTVTNGPTDLKAQNAITLDKRNDFNGAVNAQGNNVTLNDVNDMNLGNITSTGTFSADVGGTLGQGANSTVLVDGQSTLKAGSDINLNSASNDFKGAVNAEGGNITLTDSNILVLGNTVATTNLNLTSNGLLNVGTTRVGGNLVALTNNGDIIQQGALFVGGNATLNAGTGRITLNNPGNDLRGMLTVTASSSDITGSAGKGAGKTQEQVLSTLPTTPQPGLPGAALGTSTPPAPLTLNQTSAPAASSTSTTTSTGIVVKQEAAPAADGATVVSVAVPAESAAPGSSFKFELPESVRSLVQGDTQPQASLANGSPLPAWLSFDNASMSFEASAVPPGVLPIEVVVTIGDQRVVVVISASAET